MDISSQGNKTLSVVSSQNITDDIKKLKKLFEDVGIYMDLRSETCTTLKQEQALIVRDLAKYFDSEDIYQLNCFIRTMKTVCKKEKYCKKFLLPTELRKDNNIKSNIYQDCLFR